MYRKTLRLAALSMFALLSTHVASPTRAQQPMPPAARSQAGWREFTSREGGFKVQLPGEPKISRVPFRRGPLELVRNVHRVETSSYHFEVDYTEMPAGTIDPELGLEGGMSALAAATKSNGGRVLMQTGIKRGACEGREMLTLTPTPGGTEFFSQARIFTAGQRFYFLLFLSLTDDEAARRTASRFLESFSLPNGCPAAAAAVPAGKPVVSSVAGTPDPATGWRVIDTPGHGFTVLLPGGAQLESEVGQVQPFPLTHHTYTFQSGASFYIVEVLGDYPPDFNKGADQLQVQLDILLYAIKRNLEPHGFSFTPVPAFKSGRFPGREYVFAHTKLPGAGRVQMYTTEKRSYVFMAYDSDKANAARNLERFFSSIKISAK